MHLNDILRTVNMIFFKYCKLKMFLTKLPKYTDLVRASNTRVNAESGQRLQIESAEEIRQKWVSMKVTQTNLGVFHFLS